MKKIIIITNLILFVVTTNYSQEYYGRHIGPAPERIEKYKKLRLIEELNLPDEKAIKFNRFYNEHREKMNELRKAQERYQKSLEEFIQKYDKDNEQYPEKYLKELERILREYESHQEKYLQEQKRYLENLKQLLDSQQLAKYYLFERKFHEELRKALEKMREDMPRRKKR